MVNIEMFPIVEIDYLVPDISFHLPLFLPQQGGSGSDEIGNMSKTHYLVLKTDFFLRLLLSFLDLDIDF